MESPIRRRHHDQYSSVYLPKSSTTSAFNGEDQNISELEQVGEIKSTFLGTATLHDHPDSSNWPKDLQVIGVIFGISLTAWIAILSMYVFSALGDEERSSLEFPTNLEKAQALGAILTAYAKDYPQRVLIGHGLTYIFLQAFAIPGTIFINLLGGALFGMYIGFPLCLAYNTIGSIGLFLLSKYYGKRVILHFFPQKLNSFRAVIDDNRADLVSYTIFLRLFPVTPNWFINISSPHLDIPVSTFGIAIFIGLIPYNFLSCKAGLILSELKSKNDIIDVTTMVQLGVFAVAGFFFFLLKSKYASRSTSSQKTATPSPKKKKNNYTK